QINFHERDHDLIQMKNQASSMTTDIVNLNMFTWGGISERVKPNNDLNYFLKHTFGGLVFKPIK
ncbi:hypothetical protein, partial [Xenorhabdus bovienii]|uniref:hypothetical protein n=1 Tax=Xenorhabdus bovienii TaxID=40576 RepID=UPI00215707B1